MNESEIIDYYEILLNENMKETITHPSMIDFIECFVLIMHHECAILSVVDIASSFFFFFFAELLDYLQTEITLTIFIDITMRNRKILKSITLAGICLV